jgi:hypothetical protein
MPDYRLFGGVLSSEVVIPGLSAADTDQPWWTLTRSGEAPPDGYGRRLGSEEVGAGVHATLYSSRDRLHLVFDDTGVFEISLDGRRIRWTPPPNPDLDAVGKDLLSRVFAVALHQEDFMAFHGSAVALGDVAVAFLGATFHGKSTTAAALVKSGGRFLVDDLVAVYGRNEPAVVPHDEEDRVPLAALYLLAPGRPGATAYVSRSRLSGAAAADALLAQTRIGPLVNRAMRETLLGRLAELADHVPVYQLAVPWDLNRMPEVTSQLWTWHVTPLMQASAGGGR